MTSTVARSVASFGAAVVLAAACNQVTPPPSTGALILTKVAGDSQMAGTPGLQFDPLVVTARDSLGFTRASTRVEFEVVSGGGRFAGADTYVASPTQDATFVAWLTAGPDEWDTTTVQVHVSGTTTPTLAFTVATTGTLAVVGPLEAGAEQVRARTSGDVVRSGQGRMSGVTAR